MPEGRRPVRPAGDRLIRRTAGVVMLTLMAGLLGMTGVTPNSQASAAGPPTPPPSASATPSGSAEPRAGGPLTPTPSPSATSSATPSRTPSPTASGPGAPASPTSEPPSESPAPASATPAPAPAAPRAAKQRLAARAMAPAAAASASPSGLLSRWAFDAGSGATATDSSGTRPLTLTTGASWISGAQGAYAVSLNGTTGAATRAAVVTTTSSYSVSAYVRLTNLTGTQTFVSQAGSAVSGFALQLRSDTGKFAFSRQSSDSASATTVNASSAAAPVANQWYHLVGVYDAAAGTQALYVNGALQQSVTAAAAWSATGSFAVGRGQVAGSPGSWVTGAVDDTRVYAQALSADDIGHLGEDSHWNLEEGSGTSAADETLNANTGTLTNGPTWAPGVVGSSAVRMDGTDDYIDTPGSIIDTSKSFTVAVWARADVGSSFLTYVSVDATNVSSFFLQRRDDNRWRFIRPSADSSSPGYTEVNSTATATLGTWYHLTAVYDSAAGTIALYINGVLQGTSSYTTGFKGTGHLVIGRARSAGAGPSNFVNGAVDDVRVFPYAVNAATAATFPGTPAPPQPAAPTATSPTYTSAAVSWVAPSPINGAPTTGYVVTPYLNGAAQSAQTFNSTATSQTITGLTTGGSYRFTVAAVNANGTSAPSAQSNAVTPSDVVPAAPIITAATAAQQSANLTWSAPTANGGSAVTGYVVTPYLGSTAQATQTFAANSAGTAQRVTGLTAGSAYTFTVAARNAAGTGAQSSASSSVTPTADVPAAPAAPTATAGASNASVSWVAPASNGSAITGYVVTPYLSGTAQTPVSFASTATTQTVTGLTVGGSYKFSVAAVNAVGTGPASPQSNAVTVYDVPAAPTITAVTAGTQRATVTWTAGSANGSAITGYVVTPYIGSTAQTATTFASTATTQTVTGLTAGTAYTFRVAAQNAGGTGPQSAASSAVTPNANPVVATTSPPGGVVGTAYSYQLTTSGGTAPFAWSVTTGTLPAGLSLSSAGLLSGTPTTVGSSMFTVQVSDANAQTATQSLTVTVTAKPATPAAPTATAGLTSAVLTWTAPASNGSTITGYVITPSIGGVAQSTITVDPSAKTRTLNGLTAGSIYTFTVAAVNANGTGAASGASNPVTPYAALNAPTIGTVTAGTTSASLSWTAPSSTGNSPITGYVVTPYIGSTAQTPQTFTGTATTRTVTGLTPGTAYTFKVAAQNNSGTTPLYRIDAGGTGAAALDGGPAWSDDSGPTNPLRNSGSNVSNFGAPNGVDSTVPATTPLGIFDTERWDPGNSMSWAFPVAAGTPVTVRLFFVESYWTGPGQRRFDVALDGTTVLPSFDVYTAAGGARIGTMRDFSLTSDGTVNIDFGRIQDNAIIDGIEILQTGTATTGPQSAASAAATPNANPVVTSTSPPAGVVGTTYSYQLTNSGGTSPFTWSVISGTLPAGITLSTGGLLSGTPTTVGSSTFTVQVSDAGGQTATQSLTVVVSDKPGTIAKPTAAAGPTNATVSWTAPASNGSAITGYVVTPYLSGTAQTPVSFDASTTTRTVTGLTVGGSYKFSVAAVNANGTGALSPQSDAVTIYDVPSAPTITAATAGDLRATLTWTAAGANGNAVTGYVVTPSIGGTAQTPVTFSSTALTQTITGLTAGTAYTFRVAAQNAGGTGAQSAASPAVTPNANPAVTSTSPPAGVVGTAYSYQLTNSGGTSPFTWSVITGSLPAGLTLSSAGLLSGTPTTVGSSAFTVQVSDGNAQTATSSLSIVVSSTTPSAPAKPTAAAGVTSATVSWSAPASNGSAITGYVVTPYLSGVAQTPVSFDASTTTRTVTGLAGGGSYTFTVAAVNANGTGPASVPSNAVTVTDVPAAPTITAATAGDLRVTLTWTAGAANGSAITGYVVTPYIGSTAQTAATFASTATTQTVTGLTAGTAYTFRVAAQNAVGTGAASADSSAVTPNANPTVATTSLPGGVVGVAYSSQVATAGGTSPFTWSVTSGTLPAGLTLSSAGLISGTPTTVGSSTFTVQVSDVNSQTATQSLTLVVTARPGTVAAPMATAGLTSAVLTWSAPVSNGSTITGYVITPSIGGVAQSTITVDPSAKTRTLNGLTAGSIYTFTVAAVNANGTGAASGASNPVTPYAALNAPTIGTVTAGTTSASLSWTAPTSTGNSPITGYVVTPYIGSTAQTPQTFTGTATTRTVTGLTPGTAYTFKVAATNNSGTTPLYRINAGGPAVTATDGGPDWAADNFDNSPLRTGFTGYTYFGPGASVDDTVPSSTPLAIFDAERYNDMQWAFPVSSGTAVKVRLYFANRWDGTSAPGSRPFDVALEGTTVLPGWDTVIGAGANRRGTMRDFAVISDGTVNIDLNSNPESPIISGIEILQTGTATTGPQSSASSAVTPNDNPTLTFAAPPAGEVGVAYSQQLVVNGGSAPFTWSVSSGTLPPGLSLGASSGVLSGTPTAAGSSTFTVQVTDASGATATRSVTLVVAAQPSIAFSPSPGELTVAYSQQPTLSGGTGPFTWSISAGSLPAGLSINTSTGLVSGTPTASGTFSVTVRVVDAFNQVATRTASIVIAALPTLTSTPPKQYQQAGFSFGFAATGGTGPFTYAVVSGSLPSGISLSTAGVLSGQTNQGSYPFTVRATDANGKTADDPVTLVVDAPPVQLVKTASATSVAPGGTITFTLTATNISSTFYGNTVATDPLSDVLDDATYNGDVAVTSGSVSSSASALSWAIPLNPGQSATLTYTVTVANPDTGNKILTGQVDATRSSTSCSPGQRTSACTAAVTVSGLSVTTTANAVSTTPGSVVGYSVVVANTGQTPYAGTSVTQNLSGILDDATYRGDAAAGSGAVSYASPTLTWTGALAVGASVTISYSVRVSDPDVGNRSLTVTAVSAAAGSTCPSGSPAASCTSTVTVLVPALSVAVAAQQTTATPGDPVTYRLTLTNSGQTPYAGTSAALALSGALDDATYQNAVAGAGTVGYASGTVTWSGDLAVGATVTVDVSLQVRDPEPGDRSMAVSASSAAAGSTCSASTGGSSCAATVTVLVPALSVVSSADVTSTTPGSVVSYTVVVTNTGQTAAPGAAVSIPLAGVLDDATYNGDVAGPGTVGYAGSTITWTQDLAIGATATITYSVTVRDPDPGDRSLTSTAVSDTRGSTCPTGGPGTSCTTTVAVLVPGLTIATATDSGPTTTPGTRVRYTTIVRNTGQTSYTGVVVVLDSRGVADDATFGLDGTESSGTATPQPDGTLRWVLTLAPGQSATATATFLVNDPPTGDKVLTSNATSSAPGSSCPTAASPSCSTSVTVLVPGLTLSTTADAGAVTPGDTIQYTVVAANTGETAYAPAVVTDDLSAVLTDAVYNADASATAGTPSLSGSTLTWSGSLAVGASVTITFTVTVRDPDPGNKQVLNRVVSSNAGSNCPARSTDSRCTASVTVNVPGLTFFAAAGVSSTVPGGTVTSTVTVTNSGSTAYTAATFSLPLTDVLDDADQTGTVSATSGTASYTDSTISWTGALAAGASATITYQATVHAADGGNNRLIGTVTSTSRNANCVAGGTDARCTTNVPVARLVLERVPVPPATTTPGSVLDLSVRYTNAGQVPYSGITVDIPRADSADDLFAATTDMASSGTLTRTETTTRWTGDIAVGGVVTVSIIRTVRDPDPGNHVITAPLTSDAPGSNCPTVGATDTRCTFTTTVLIPELTITKTASTTATVPGGTVGYTITVANTGQTPYAGASWTDSLAGVLDDASYAGGAVTDVGEVSYTAPLLSWSGDLAVGQTATITYSLTAKSPATGDKTMVNVVSSDAPGSTCPTGSSAAACRTTVLVLTQQLTIVKTASATNATLGSTVGYTVAVTNTGQTSYTGAAFSSSLSGVLDDASYNGDAAVSGPGSIGYTGGVLSWSGNLSPGVTATITYSVTINDPSAGDLMLTGAVVSSTVGNNCAASSTDARCSADVAVTNAVSLTLTKTADVLVTVAGALVHYTVTAVNSSSSQISGANVTDSLAGVLDDADIEGSVTASSGTVTRTGSNISWGGDLPAGGTVTISYAVRVRTPPPGDLILTGNLTSTSPSTSNNCLAASTDPRCVSTVPVAALVIHRYYSQTSTTPGSTIRLNATFTNTGQYAYHGISVSSPTADSSDDAVPTGDQTATSGTLVLSATKLTWTGDIPVGGTVFLTGTLLVKDPDTGNRNITAMSTSSALGNNCQTGSSDTRCTSSLPVLLPELTLAKSADTAQASPGDLVSYTVSVTDSGETPYAGATVTDDLTGVLDGAALVGEPEASSGSVSVDDGVLTWTGGLAVDDVVTISYSVRVSPDDLGDRYLTNTVSSSDVGSTCQPFSDAPACTSLVRVLSPALRYTVRTHRETARPGQVVTTTLLVANEGETTYAAARVSLGLSDVLDDAAYNNDATVVGSNDDDGTLSVVNGVLSWSGPLDPGDTASITFSVTVDNPVTGNFRLDQTAASDDLGAFCSSGTDSLCSTSVPIASLHMSDVATPNPVDPLGVVRFTETYTNVGQVPLYGVHITIDGRGTFDDATYNGDATPSSGSLTLDPNSALLTWSGDIAVGQSVTTTGSVTVDYPLRGDQHLRTRISTDEVPSNCPSASTDPECLIDVAVLTPGLSIVTTPGASTTTPGASVGYTTTVTNTGETAYTGITVSHDLSGVLDDTMAPTNISAVNGQGASGQATFAGSTLTWTGDVPVGVTVTISYAVTVRNPDPADLNLVTNVSSDALGSSCPSGGSAAGCSSLVTVLIPHLSVSVVPDSSTGYPGAVVTYTLTVTNDGQTDQPGATAVVALGGVLDDAVYGGDAAPSTGSVDYTTPNLTWTGDLGVTESATVTYTVTVNDPDAGNRSLLTSVSSATTGSSCPVVSPCTSTVTVQIPALSVSVAADTASARPGQRVTFTITIHNTGQRTYLGTVTTSSLAGVLDDGSLQGGFRASSGIVSYSAPNLTWTGTLLVGATATVRYTVQVDDPDGGDRALSTTVVNQSAGSTCRSDSTSSLCAESVTVLVPALQVSVAADSPTTTPGSTVTYTMLVVNTGETPYTAASVTSSLSGVLTDASYGGAQITAGGGELAYADDLLTWTGDLAVGASATVTYSVTVYDPDPGDKSMLVTIASAESGSSCPTPETAGCSATVLVRVPVLEVRLVSNPETAVASGPVAYYLSLTNSGETDYPATPVTISLAGVLDDATLDPSDVQASSGTTELDGQTLTWSPAVAQGESVYLYFPVTTTLPVTGDQSLDATVVAPQPGSNCRSGSADALCASHTSLRVPELTITKTASATHVVAGQRLSYTVTATNTGEADYGAALLSDDLSSVLQHATDNEDVTASTGDVSDSGGVVSWRGPLSIDESVVITYSVTVASDQLESSFVLTNWVSSPSPGSTCPDDATDPRCSTSTTVDATTLTLSGLTSSFTLTGLPGDTVTLDDAVVGTVATNSNSGYTVTVRAVEEALVGRRGNPDSILVDRLLVRASGSSAYTPLSATTPVRVGTSDTASAPGGDAISTDVQLQIPDVNSDTYSGELEYVVGTQ